MVRDIFFSRIYNYYNLVNKIYAWYKYCEGSKATWEKIMQKVILISEAHGFWDFKQNWVVTFSVKQWKKSILCQENEYLIGADC